MGWNATGWSLKAEYGYGYLTLLVVLLKMLISPWLIKTWTIKTLLEGNFKDQISDEDNKNIYISDFLWGGVGVGKTI